jgi:dynein heavy chain
LENKVPVSWKKYSYLSNKTLAAWVEDFKLRQEFFKRWNIKTALNSFFFSAFFFPQVNYCNIKGIFERD